VSAQGESLARLRLSQSFVHELFLRELLLGELLVCEMRYGADCLMAFGWFRGLIMPIYEYVCTACGLEKDFIQRMSADPLTVCPACQGETLRKKISAAGFRLKGSGWYETDFKTGGKKNLAGDSTPAAASNASAGSSEVTASKSKPAEAS
tara:strand:+ start:1344 stop:1793 length:450 start_codon:yes stop_codon:yes gene_type:complete